VARVRPRGRQIVSLLATLALVCGGVELPAPRVAQAITCGFGAPITDWMCRGYITSGTTFIVPSDWNSNNNTVETIGAGGGGSNGFTGNGGGGGAYAEISNLSLTEGAPVTYNVGASGPGGAQSNSVNLGGTAGGDTWFNGASLAGSSVGAKGGKVAGRRTIRMRPEADRQATQGTLVPSPITVATAALKRSVYIRVQAAVARAVPRAPATPGTICPREAMASLAEAATQ
jgi:hypothetical protein